MDVKSQQCCFACMVTIKLRTGPEVVEMCKDLMEAVPVLEVFAVGLRRAIHPLTQPRSLEDSVVLERQSVPESSLQSIRKTSTL